VILINLLPHREAARKRRREYFFATLLASVAVGVLIGGAIYTWFQSQISTQKGKNAFLKAETVKLENQIKDIASLQQEITALRARQTAVENLQGDRNLPVHLLSELVKQLPDGVYVSTMKQDNQVVSFTGVAQSNERVSELLRNLANNSPWLTRPELVEITAGTVALTPRDQRRVSNFSMKVTLKRPTDQAKAAASAASAAISSPSGVPQGAAAKVAPASSAKKG
jgi:type IV pilus assembly protein PilN